MAVGGGEVGAEGVDEVAEGGLGPAGGGDVIDAAVLRDAARLHGVLLPGEPLQIVHQGHGQVAAGPHLGRPLGIVGHHIVRVGEADGEAEGPLGGVQAEGVAVRAAVGLGFL